MIFLIKHISNTHFDGAGCGMLLYIQVLWIKEVVRGHADVVIGYGGRPWTRVRYAIVDSKWIIIFAFIISSSG
jgi:hypothetical protein